MGEPPATDPTPAPSESGDGPTRDRPKVSARTIFFVVAALSTAVIVGSIVFANNDEDPPDSIAQALEDAGNEGDQVPTDPFVMFDGTSATFADFSGQPMVVNFFASWCAPCRKEMPDFQTVYEDLGDKVTFLGLASGDRLEDAIDLVEETGITFAVASDPGEFLTYFGGIAMPTTALVSADGTIVDVHSGPLSEDDLRDRIDEYLGI